MEPRDVALTTITWVRAPSDEALLTSSLIRLAALGLPIAVADRGASQTFTDTLASLSNVDAVTADSASHPGLVRQVRVALTRAAATGRRVLLYTEPDKGGFFGDPSASALLDLIARAPDDGRPGVVLAARSARSFETFPPTQRLTEGVLNTLCGDRLGVPGDYSYGPFLLPVTMLPVIESLDPSLGWGWRHACFLAAHGCGCEVRHVVGDHDCPEDQRSEDAHERAHRVQQLSENLRGLLA